MTTTHGRPAPTARVAWSDRARSRVARAFFRVGGFPPSSRLVVRETGLRIPVGEGVELVADQWFPGDAPDAPLLLVRGPYGRGAFGFQYGRLMAHLGFRVLFVSCRGTAGSGGSFDQPFAHEAQDGQAVVAWLREQPWFQGSFATIGGSYLGYTQLALATDPPPELVAMVLQVAPTNVADLLWTNGAPALGDMLFWAASVSQDPVFRFRDLVTDLALRKKVGEALTATPLLQSYRKVSGARIQFFEDWIGHPPDDPFWAPQDSSSALDRVSVPVLVQAGWFDRLLPDSIEQYQRLAARGVTAALTVGPWSHATFFRATQTHALEAAAWLHAAFRGITPVRSDQPVRVRLLGTDEWRELSTWPPPDTVPTPLYLQAQGGLTVTPPGRCEPDAFTYDPMDPTPAVGGNDLGPRAGSHDNQQLERRADVLTYTADVRSTPLDVLGQPVVTLWLTSSAASTDVFVRLCDVHPDGRSLNLCDQIVRITPIGDPQRLEIRLPHAAFRIAEGHRLRLQVSSGAHPRYQRNLGSGEAHATAAVPQVARQLIHHDEGHPSALVLPVAP